MARHLTYNNITDTIQGWARRLNISDVTIRRRLAAGYSDEKALTEPVLPPRGSRPKLYEYNGESKRLIEWAEQYGMSEVTLRRRLTMGWSMEQALTTSLKDKGWGGSVSRPRKEIEDTSIDDIINILNK